MGGQAKPRAGERARERGSAREMDLSGWIWGGNHD